MRDTATDIQRWREAREREEEAQKQKEKVRREETTHSAEEGVAEKCARRDRSDRKINTEGRGEAHLSYTQDTRRGT